jgi:four helix bundle protein
MAGARHYKELIAWQLADQIRVETSKLTRRDPFGRDFKHQRQTEDAIDSVCRNIAEGFGCESHAEFARFLEIARRSLNELLDCLRSAELKGYVSSAELVPIHDLARREFPAVGNLMAYLRRTSARRSNRTSRSRDRTGQR